MKNQNCNPYEADQNHKNRPKTTRELNQQSLDEFLNTIKDQTTEYNLGGFTQISALLK